MMKNLNLWFRWGGIFFFLASLSISGCLALEPPGGGGGTERKIEGTYISMQESNLTEKIGKTLIFTSDGNYKFYLDNANVGQGEPTFSSTYKLFDNAITFKKEDGTEFEEKGELMENDTKIKWAEHQGEIFVKQ